MAKELPWDKTRFLLYDPNSLKILDEHLHNVSGFICSLFSQLDWETFTKRLAASKQTQLISNLGLSLLKLILKISLINKNAIPLQLKYKLIPPTAFQNKDQHHHHQQQQESYPQPILDWCIIDPNVFYECFSGEVLISLLKDGLVQSDPSSSLVEICHILKAIALDINHSKAALACIIEVCSLLFMAVYVRPDHYWYLPFSDQTNLLSNIVVSLTHSFASKTNDSREMTLYVLSCLIYKKWVKIESIPLQFYNAHSFPDGRADCDPSYDHFYKTIKGIILQFCGASSPPLALQIFSSCPLPGFNNENAQLDPVVWCEVIEMTLRTFFVSIEGENPLLLASANLNVSRSDRFALAEVAKQTSHSFALLVLLNHWKAEIEGMDPSVQWPSSLFDLAIDFSPNPYRNFDLLPLWFFIIELVESPRFHPVQSQNDVSII